jgi:hypothetical protein
MHDVEITEIASGVRSLTVSELAMIAGGGAVGDLAKIAGGLIGGLIFGPWGAAGGAAAVVAVQAGYDSYDSGAGPGAGVNSNIADAAL